MEHALKHYLLRKVKNTKCKNTVTSVHICKTNDEDFIKAKLREVEESNKGVFFSHSIRKDYYLYKCDRHRKPKGKNYHPTKTRANNCDAYISFSFECNGNIRGCILRHNLNHNGHDTGDPVHKSTSRIHPDLCKFIESLLLIGYSNTEVLMECVQWSEERGHKCKHDRRYFPTPNDISNLKKSYLRSVHYDANDAISTEKLLRNDLKEEVVLYQPKNVSLDHPLIIVLQSEEQRKDMITFGKKIIFIDASYSGLTSYGYAVYIMTVRNAYGHGIPVGTFVLSEENKCNLATCFKSIREKASGFYPRAFMVDKDLKLVDAINEAYSDVCTSVLLCWFHVLQAIHRWLVSAKGAGYSGVQYKDKRGSIINFIRILKKMKTNEEFMTYYAQEGKKYDDKVASYIQDNWINIGMLWADFGRQFFHEESDTNNLSERMFLRVKYQFLKGWTNRRLDDLLVLLSTTIKSYFGYIKELHECGRIQSNRNANLSKIKAENMMSAGIGNQIVWKTEVLCYVPSETTNVKWSVNLITYTCTCPVSNLEGGCKHLQLALLMSQKRGFDLQKFRQEIAMKLFNTSDYIVSDEKIFITCEEYQLESIIDFKSMVCNCVSSSQNIECVCLILAKLYKPVNINNEDLVASNDLSSFNLGTDVPQKISVQEMVDFLQNWVHSEEYEESQEFETLISKPYNFITKGFKKKKQNKKIKPLAPYRKAIDLKKKAIDSHNYATKYKLQKYSSKKRKTKNDFVTISTSLTLKKKNREKSVSSIYSCNK